MSNSQFKYIVEMEGINFKSIYCFWYFEYYIFEALIWFCIEKNIVINVKYQWSYVTRCSDDRINTTFFFQKLLFVVVVFLFFCFLFALEWFCIIFCICLYKIICIKSISVRKTKRNENILELNLLTWEGYSERESCRAIER